MIDFTFYRLTNPELVHLTDEELLEHYTNEGWKAGRDPSALFSVAGYLAQNRDVVKANIEPLKHYLKYGQTAGRLAYLSRWGRQTADLMTIKDLDLCKNWINIQKLKEKKPEFADLSNDALISWYLMDGCYNDIGSSALFSSSFYLATYPDVAKNGMNPLRHYLRFGLSEGRCATLEEFELSQTSDRDTVRQDFDANWYRKTYPDVEGDDDSILAHYMMVGWKEGYDPSSIFSTTYYLDFHDDVASKGVNPLLHYVKFGRRERRRCSIDAPVRIAYSETAHLTPSLPNLGQRQFDFIQVTPPESIDQESLNIHWIVPDFTAGSGGHMTIFRMVRHLENFGHHNTIWIERPIHHKTEKAAWETIVKHFQCVEAEVHFVSDALRKVRGNVVIATGWSTAWCVKDLTGFNAQMYFVQDHEPEFFPTGSMSNLAEQTYGLDLGCICAGTWLKDLMSEHYGRWAQGFDLAYEPEEYFVANDASLRTVDLIKIAVYGRIRTDRRCVELVLAGLEVLARTRKDFEVHFFGQDVMPFAETPFTAFNHSVLDSKNLADLYNECDIGICFSGTNYSLIPQEMMACGLPVIEFDTDSTRAIFPEDTIMLAGPLPIDIANKITKMMDSPEQRERQRVAALKWVGGFSWKETAQRVEQILLNYLDYKNTKLSAPNNIKSKNVLFDIVVPTWNADTEFPLVLEAIRRQSIADQIQIHCIDSSSTDGTIAWLKNQKDVSLTVIEKNEFQHGRTRNLGASLGKAPFIGFLTQDAMPATPEWAIDILKMMHAVPNAAGLFGRHIAYPNHSIFVQTEIKKHFENMLQYPLILSKDTNPERWESGDLGWRKLLHFYSDNNSAMRREIWNSLPYPEVDYGEDQVWARDIIEAGYTKLYAPTATVYHSHDFDSVQTYKRARTESSFFYEYFGYKLGEGSEEDIAERIKREQRDIEIFAHNHRVSGEQTTKRKEIIIQKYRGWRDGWQKYL